MKAMQYKGYAARIEYSDEDGCLVGHIAGIKDIVGFHGGSVSAALSVVISGARITSPPSIIILCAN